MRKNGSHFTCHYNFDFALRTYRGNKCSCYIAEGKNIYQNSHNFPVFAIAPATYAATNRRL